MRSWIVRLYCVDGELELAHRQLLGAGTFWADTAEDATECAMETW